MGIVEDKKKYELHLGKVTFSKEQTEMMNHIIDVKEKEAQKELLEQLATELVDIEDISYKNVFDMIAKKRGLLSIKDG